MAQRSVQERAGARVAFGLGSFLVVVALLAAACGSAAGYAVDGRRAGLRPGRRSPRPRCPARRHRLPPATRSDPPMTARRTSARRPAAASRRPTPPVRSSSAPASWTCRSRTSRRRSAPPRAPSPRSAATWPGRNRSGDADRASASVTFRIPAARWSDALDALRKLGTKVLGEQTSSQEVTSQVVDLGARLANLRVTETALQAIMDKATKIPDVLAVQEQLTTVRQQIEELSAQKQTLENQAALSTLTVNLTPPPAVAVTQVREGWDPAREVDQAAAALVGLGQGIAGAGDLAPDRLAADPPGRRDRCPDRADRVPAVPAGCPPSDGHAAHRRGMTGAVRAPAGGRRPTTRRERGARAPR